MFAKLFICIYMHLHSHLHRYISWTHITYYKMVLPRSAPTARCCHLESAWETSKHVMVDYFNRHCVSAVLYSMPSMVLIISSNLVKVAYSDDLRIVASFWDKYIRKNIITLYSFIWINVDGKWLLLEQFKLTIQKYFWHASQKLCRLFCCGGVSENRLIFLQ